VERIRRIISEGIDSGRFIAIDAEKTARAIVLITMGAFNFYFSLDADFDPAEQHSFDIDHIIRGLKKPATDAVVNPPR
ncbi:MAG: YoaH family protein, partial [Planctomycetes bacterium]|nr:YoaH family protein [Planctomycetota bacterium]